MDRGHGQVVAHGAEEPIVDAEAAAIVGAANHRLESDGVDRVSARGVEVLNKGLNRGPMIRDGHRGRRRRPRRV